MTKEIKAIEQKEIEELKNAIVQYYFDEYEDNKEKSFQLLKNLEVNPKTPVAYTTHGDSEELIVEVFLNYQKLTLELFVTGTEADEGLKGSHCFNCKNVQELIDIFTHWEMIDFVSLNDTVDLDQYLDSEIA